MRHVKSLLFVVGMFCLVGANAQVNLRLDPIIIGLSSTTINKDSVYNLMVTIYNDSATDFAGIINIGASINGQLLADTSVSAIYYPTDTQEIISHNSSITRPLKLNADSASDPGFIIGTSGVVIWPIAVSNPNHLNITISDTLSYFLTVLPPVGIDELTARNLKVYMAGQQLVIQNNGAYPLKNVKMYDVAGKLLVQKEISVSGTVDMNQYANGVYLAEINFADNIRAIVKVVNTR